VQLVLKHRSIAQATKHDQRPQPRDHRVIIRVVGLERGRQRRGETVQPAAVRTERGEERLEPGVGSCQGVVGEVPARPAKRFGFPPRCAPSIEAELLRVEQGDDACKGHVDDPWA
jgi:hypothetical protein